MQKFTHPTGFIYAIEALGTSLVKIGHFGNTIGVTAVLYLLFVFAVVFIIVLAFSPSEREPRVRTVMSDGHERIEIHQSVSASAAQTAARFVVGFVVGIIVLLGALVLYTSL